MGRLHAQGDRGRSRRLVQGAEGNRDRQRLPPVRQAAGRRLLQRGRTINDDGTTSNASTVYTEYFVKGTEPGETCPLHGSQSFVSRVAGWFGASPSAPSQERASEAVAHGHEEADVRHADRNDDGDDEDKPAEMNQPPEKKKKRGFWSKVFGRGDDKDDKKDEKKPR